MPGLTSAFKIPDRTVELVVVGLGPAGVACALQAHRDGLDVLAVGDEPVGGLVRAARRLDNLPAEPGITGTELAERMSQQIERSGIPFGAGQVQVVDQHPEGFLATLASGRRIRTRCVCLATGTRPRTWDIPVGKRTIHRDARTLPDELRDVAVVVIGGGEAALDTALTCQDRGARVTLVARGDRLRAVERLIEESRTQGVELQLETSVVRILGGPGDWTLATPNGSLRAGLLLVCIGRVPRDDLAQDLLSKGFANCVVQSQVPGLTLAGDLIRGRERYVATAMGDGQRAALAAAAYLKEAS